MNFEIGQVIFGNTPNTREIFGRILAIHRWQNDEDNPISCIVIEDSPTVGNSLQFIQGDDLNHIEVIEGSGFPASRWKLVEGTWVKD